MEQLNTKVIKKVKKNPVKTILTHRGYAIIKEQFGFKDINRTKKDLTVSPYVNESFAAKATPFPIYLESDKKLFLPKHYGFENYGVPDQIKNINNGVDIDLEFNGTLRPSQEDPINAFLKSCDTGNKSSKSNGGIISIGCGGGKCLKKDTPIMMYDGSIKMVQNISVGDKIMGDDSTPRNIISLARGRETMYEIIPTRGDPYTVNESHILSLQYTRNVKQIKKGTKIDIPVKDYIDLSKKYTRLTNPLVGYRTEVLFPNKNVDLDPYVLGYWLGDYYSRGSLITTSNNKIISYFNSYTAKLGLHFVQLNQYRSYTRRPKTFKITNIPINKTNIQGNLRKIHMFQEMLINKDLIRNKHIPHTYKCNSKKVQLDLLAGIIDSGGCLYKNGYNIITKEEILLDDIIFIARSLGLCANKKRIQRHIGKNIKETYFETYIYGKNVLEIPIKNKYKIVLNNTNKNVLLTKITVDKKNIDDYFGFEIDGNHRFLLGDTTVTHNTVLGLYLTAKLKKKTLIIVHKEFLINQWKERIEQFLPSARVGVIQASKIETENKDIVIGMLQSISMKEYPWETFDDFGFTIVDECFPHDTPIITDRGLIDIGELYNKWDNNENIPEILSFNQTENQFEFKKLTYAWKKVERTLIRIKTSNRSFRCTPNHKILTLNGYLEAKNIKTDDIIISKYTSYTGSVLPALNDDQKQFIYGSYLSSRNIYLNKNKRSILKISHIYTEKEYCFWKAHMFQCTSDIKFIENYPIKSLFKFYTREFDLTTSISDDNFTTAAINNIDPRGIAIWYMDKGTYQNINKTASIEIPIYDVKIINSIIKLFEKYNIYTRIYYKGLYNHVIIFNRQNTLKLFELINPYIHHSMIYKTEIYNNKNEKYIWDNKFLKYGTLRVTDVNYIENSPINTKPYVFDIEVNGNHNFIIGNKKKDGTEDLSGPVVSNCHHIGAEVFSRALPKINSKYGLGLSATPKRKDGLSKVFHWFIGPTLYENKIREGLLPIHVNVAMYTCPDKIYSKMELTGFGKICMARMVNNITEFGRRIELIINIIQRLRKINRKILILSDRRKHLTEIYDIVNEREIATVGYYVGGMKQKELKESEGKDVLLGTYNMSSEGMDIPDLDAVIFASPRSDIIQSIGRIMRKKHETNPICWDIVDNFSVFPKQYEKRRAYYRKMKYPINTYDINDDISLSLSSIITQLDNIPTEDVKKKKSKAVENIIINDYNFIDES